MNLCLQNLRSRLTCALFLWCLLPVSGIAVADEERVLFDFEGRTLSIDWQAFGSLKARRDELNGPDSADVPPTGNGVWIESRGNAGLFTRSQRIDRDWRKYSTLSFWVYRSRAEARLRKQSIIEVQLREDDLNAGFWRRVQVDHQGWKEVRLPLTWFRWRRGRIASWDRLDRLGFWFRDEAELIIDRIAVIETDEVRNAFVGARQLQNPAFPKSDNGNLRLVDSAAVEILTNEPRLNTDQLAAHLARVSKAIDEKFPEMSNSDLKPVLMVFSTKEEYKAFTPKLAAMFAGSSTPPQSSGFTMLGVAMSYWDDQYGSLRPTYTHEFVHGLIARRLLVQNGGGWIHEGIASLLQLQFHPQENFPEIVVAGLKSDRMRTPLKELCNGNRIPAERYWQAATVVECLLETPHYKNRVPKLLNAMSAAGSTDLTPHLELLDTDWEKLTSDWMDHCKETY